MKKFYKYHGAGNDFILINNIDGKTVLSKEQIISLCDRHKGIGADGLILLESSVNMYSATSIGSMDSPQAYCFMNYYNSDGTQAEMCGNGIRCTAKFFLDQTRSKLKELLIDTRAGVKKIICNTDESFSVNMGTPVFSHKDFPNEPLIFEGIKFDFVSIGNPHAVGFVENIFTVDVSRTGPRIEKDFHFPNKINVEFVEKVSETFFRVKVWERGCGETLACGTGACAVYAVLKNCVRQDLTQSLTQNEITLEFPGDNLYLSENKEGEIILRGPAECVFKGKMN
ncbi:MAG: diaminopimelate epimerase [bacterium]